MNGVDVLLEAVRSGRTQKVPALVAALGPAERRACLAELKRLRKEIRNEWSERARRQAPAVLVAGAGCHTGPAGAATWIRGQDFVNRGLEGPELSEMVGLQPPEWQVEVVTRIAGNQRPSWSWPYFGLVDSVIRRTGCEVPASDAYAAEWLRRRIWGIDDRGHALRGPRATLVERLRADELLPVLVARSFELADLGGVADFGPADRPEGRWPGALAALAAEGRLDGAELIDRSLARLVRGGRPGDQRVFLDVLRALGPTPEEYAARVRDLVALLDGLSVVAGHAQQVLAGLDEAGLIEPEVLAEASSVVLFRTEKKLVRAQLSWLDQAAKRAPERAGPVLLTAAEAFGHPDTALQERALNLVARHLKKAGEAVLAELRLAAEGLNPAHHERAGELLGAPVGGDGPDAGWSELLPPVPRPARLGEPIATPAELAEELSVLLSGRPGVVLFERVLDGLVRHARLDRPALAEALEPVLRVHPWTGAVRWGDCEPVDVLYVAAAVAGQVEQHRSGPVFRNKGRHALQGAHYTAYGKVLAARLSEAAERIITDRPPFLLATPTDATGALDAAVLVGRLAGYEAVGARPGEADLHAALLRVTPTTDDEVLADAGRLVSPGGRWVAQWLRDGGLPGQPSERVVFAPGRSANGSRLHGHTYWERWWEELNRVSVAQPGLGAGPQGPAGERLGAEFRALLDGTEPSVARARKQDEWMWRPTAHWAAMLPHHREEQAARWLDRFADAADREQRGAPELLPVLAEAGGPAGLALHLALAYGLGARFAEDRTAAVDALLVLAAREELDGALLGRELGDLVARGAVKPNRLGQALAAAAETGAYGTVWSVLGPALPALLAGDAVRGTGDVLAVAVDAARRCGARGPVPEVDAVAARSGSSRLVKEARTLRDLLAG
ncbi:DUF6493 family protein [Kitasatospora sp. NPDC127111]|uniref:DUF6493 family protein n=1 Tax=Kitasatospora sp. NPDC127111 TaxID=3345363 RepID=UPI00362718F6